MQNHIYIIIMSYLVSDDYAEYGTGMSSRRLVQLQGCMHPLAALVALSALTAESNPPQTCAHASMLHARKI